MGEPSLRGMGWCCPAYKRLSTHITRRTGPERGGPLPLSLQSPVGVAGKRRDVPGAFLVILQPVNPEGWGIASGAGGSSADLSPSPGPGPGASTKCSSQRVHGTEKKEPPKSSRATRKSSVIRGAGRLWRGEGWQAGASLRLGLHEQSLNGSVQEVEVL